MCKNNGFSVLTGLGLELAAEPLRAPVWDPKWDPVWPLNLPIFAQRAAKEAKKMGSKIGPKNKSMKNRLEVENGPAADPTPGGSEAMGKDIGRGKPLPME